MVTKSKTPLSNMADTLTKPAKGKADKKPASIPESQLVELGSELGLAYLGVTTASEALKAKVEEARKIGFKPIDLRKAKSDPEGAKATKVFKGAFIDSITANSKITARTAGDYYELVATSIKTGKDITTTNPRKAKGNAQKSNGGASDDAKMTGALLNVWKLSDVASEALERIEASIDEGMTLIEAIENELKLQGEDLTTAE